MTAWRDILGLIISEGRSRGIPMKTNLKTAVTSAVLLAAAAAASNTAEVTAVFKFVFIGIPRDLPSEIINPRMSRQAVIDQTACVPSRCPLDGLVHSKVLRTAGAIRLTNGCI